MFELQFGFVGSKERYVAKRFMEEEYKECEHETKLYIERRHQGTTRGQFFDDIEELVEDNYFLDEYKDIEAYINEEIEDLDEEEKEEFEIDEDIKNIFDEKEKDEVVYSLSDGCNIRFDTDKTSLILNMIADGQYQRIYNNVDEIIEAIESDEEITTVYIYNYMSNYDRDKYLEEIIENEN